MAGKIFARLRYQTDRAPAWSVKGAKPNAAQEQARCFRSQSSAAAGAVGGRAREAIGQQGPVPTTFIHATIDLFCCQSAGGADRPAVHQYLPPAAVAESVQLREDGPGRRYRRQRSDGRPQNVEGSFIYSPGDQYNRINQLLTERSDAQKFALPLQQLEADPFDDRAQLKDIPKNAVSAGTEYLITPNLVCGDLALGFSAANPAPTSMIANDPASSASAGQDLLNETTRGDALYETGQASLTNKGNWYQDSNGEVHQGFYDEWDFHHYMNQATQATTQGESCEYRRRNDALAKAFGELADNSHFPNALGKLSPGDTQTWEGDPFPSRSNISQIAQVQLAQPPSTMAEGITTLAINTAVEQFESGMQPVHGFLAEAGAWLRLTPSSCRRWSRSSRPAR